MRHGDGELPNGPAVSVGLCSFPYDRFCETPFPVEAMNPSRDFAMEST
jgi:hypothetical protein